MALRRSSSLLIALLLVLTLVAAACGGSGGEEGDGVGGAEGGQSELEPVEGGTLIFGAEQEPTEGLNQNLSCCTLFWNVVINNRQLLSAMEPNPEFEYGPSELLAGEPEVTEDPFSITYNINPDAVWSDGEPITSEDFVFTAETAINEKFDIASRDGYTEMDMEATEVTDEKTVTFNFTEPYAGWRELFDPVLPKHVLEGEDFDKVWTNGIVDPATGEGIASGPFVFESYNKGADLTLVRNENWYGEHPAYLDKIVFRFIEETTSEIQAVRGGEVQAIYPQPQLELVELNQEPSVEIQTNAGTTWEHIDFQYASGALEEDYVRKAIAEGIDRQGIIDQLFKDILPSLEPLNNLIFMSNAPEYEEHFQDYGGNPEEATALLEDNGCTKGGDGIYECNGERLSFGFKSTAGNALRELTFEIIQEQLKKLGIEIKSEFGDPAVVFGPQGLSGGKYDLFMFGWVGNPDPAGSVNIHSCNDPKAGTGIQNYQNYCNEEVTDLLDESNRTVDPAERADLMNQADELMAEDMPILPLYQKPTFLAYDKTVQNMIDNPTQHGPTWNAEDWFISEEGAE